MMLKWTKEKPPEVGWYWQRRNTNWEIETKIVYVRNYVGKMCIMNWEIPDNAEWAGPIPEPK